MQSPPERPVYLLGESFGGVLALAVAEARPDLVRLLMSPYLASVQAVLQLSLNLPLHTL